MHRIMKHNRGFTLIEILVVMAISIILVGLVLAPVVQSFNMTRRAQAMVDAQDSARTAMEQISRELGQAMYVFDNSTGPIAVHNDGSTPAYLASGEGPIQLPVRQASSSIQCFTLPFGKIDFILPKMTMHCNNPNTDEHPDDSPRDYPRYIEQGGRKYYLAWPSCPVCQSANVDARPSLPLSQDVTVVRYFLGLRYNDPDKDPMGTPVSDLASGEGLFGWKSPWVGEVEAGAENQVVLYRAEFDPHDNSLFPADMPVSERLSDPIFFYRTAPNSDGVPCCRRWQEVAQVVGMGKYQDLAVGKYDSNGNVLSVEPTVTFRFSAINNDTFSGTYSQSKGFDYPDAVPSVFEGAYGYWTPGSYAVTVYRDNMNIAYSTAIQGGNLVVLKHGAGAPAPTFNISEYLNTGRIVTGGTGNDPVEMAFTVDLNRGLVNFALRPPRPVGQTVACLLDPQAINGEFHDLYSIDRGSARRMDVLSTFAPGTEYYLANARIVPGSERVTGLNMTPGLGGGRTLYERVPLALGDPGPNQYKIDYDTGVVYFSSVFNHNLPVITNSSGETAPGAMIEVDYKVYFNRPGDVVKGDYTTKSLVNVHLSMRMFDPESGKPATVDLNNSIKVRNALR